MTELELRAAATTATFERFAGKPLILGKIDCARMVAFHLKQLGFRPSLLKGGAYSTEVGARRALMRLGVSSLSEVMDRHFPRIAPSEARLGDVLCVEGDGGMGDAMMIKLHRDQVLGFLDGACGELVIKAHGAAWRVV